MADIKFDCIGLDGTLLTTDKKLTDRTKAVLKAARDRGIKVVLTTGRPLKAMDFFLHELGTDGQEDEYTITFNGGLVQKNTGEILDKTVFSIEMWHACTRKLEKTGITVRCPFQKEPSIKSSLTKKVSMPSSTQP